ncbi:fibronectin type III domain-containing protein [Micromonospora sp. CPCC 205371]|nr:fibronectin type III domain-containing protein [Micromonospora sp. CPCC 205371]
MEFTAWEWPVVECCQATAGLLTHDHEYEFKIVAINAGGESAPSNLVRQTATLPQTAAPTNLQAAPGDRSVTLTWTSPDPDAWHWVYQRDVTAGEAGFTRLGLPVTSCCTFTATELTNGHAYQFRVAAIGAEGEPDSAQSNTASATPAGQPPDAPSDLVATPGNAQVSLQWAGSTTPGAWYWIYSRDVTAGQAWVKLELPVTTCCTFTSTGLVNGHTYEFKVAAIGAGGPDSPPTNVASATPVAPAPAAPSNLRATAGSGQAVLTWTASSTPGAWYWVYSRDVTAGQAWVKLELPVTTCCTFTSTGLVNGHTYEFKVAAIGAAGAPDSAPSNVARAVPTAPRPGPPTNLQAVAGNAKVTLTWTASSTVGAWYWVYMRDTTAGQTWQKLDLPVTTCCTFTSTGLVNGHRYDFKVVAIGSGGGPDSYASNVVSARPVAPTPGAPSNLRATAGNAKVTLTWNASSTAGAWYWVYSRNVSAGQSWQKSRYPVSSCCTYVAGYLTNGNTYEFKVAAIGSGGAPDSASSNVVSARPVAPTPAPPTNVKAAITSYGVVLTWNASSTPGAWYWVERRNTSVNEGWKRYQYPVSTCCSFVATMLSHGIQEFRLRSIGSGGAPDSAPSNVASVNYSPPAVPTGLHLKLTTYQGSRAVSLSWNPGRQGTTFVIQARNRTKNGSWYTIAERGINWYTWPCAGTDLFEFRVYAENTVGASWYSKNVMMLGPNEGWQRYTPPQKFLWDKYSPWYHAGSTTEECPVQQEFCYRWVQFWSKGGESYWRHGTNGQLERSFLSAATYFRYKSCIASCSTPGSWNWAILRPSCRPKQQFGKIMGVEPYLCFVFHWL